jgi:hypothetical protein
VNVDAVQSDLASDKTSEGILFSVDRAIKAVEIAIPE